MLVTVPGGSDGPSGVLVCCENYLVYKNFGEQSDLRCPIPRRQHDLDDAERSMLFVCCATHRTKVSGFATVLCLGDVPVSLCVAHVLFPAANRARRYFQGYVGI
jgi:hypothetical protein